MFLFGPGFSVKTTPRKPSILVGFLHHKKELCMHPLVSGEAGPLLRQPEKVQIDLGKRNEKSDEEPHSNEFTRGTTKVSSALSPAGKWFRLT
jgi:hypothetical protein